MPIWPYVSDLALSPDDVDLVVATYHETRKALGYGDDDNPSTRAIAHAVIEAWKEGERDSKIVVARVLRSFQVDG